MSLPVPADHHLLFVYGTLKRGEVNHHYLRGQTFIGPAVTHPGYVLYALSGYPGMVVDASSREGVSGEIWQVTGSCRAELDAFEGVPEGLYRREVVPLAAPYERWRIEAYIYAQSTAGREVIGHHWPRRP